jgi:hypothetical protein
MLLHPDTNEAAIITAEGQVSSSITIHSTTSHNTAPQKNDTAPVSDAGLDVDMDTVSVAGSPSKRVRTPSVEAATPDKEPTKLLRSSLSRSSENFHAQALKEQRLAAERQERARQQQRANTRRLRHVDDKPLSPVDETRPAQSLLQQTTISQFMPRTDRNVPSIEPDHGGECITGLSNVLMGEVQLEEKETKEERPHDDQPVSPAGRDLALPKMQNAPSVFTAAIGALLLREINTPGNGSCFYYALAGTKAAECPSGQMTLSKRDSTEANFYRKHLNRAFTMVLSQWIKDGLINEASLLHRYTKPGEEVPKGLTQARIVKHLLKTSIQKCDTTIRNTTHWAGREECMAAVLFLREPLFVYHVAMDGLRAFVEMYYLEDTRAPGAEAKDIVFENTLDPATAYHTLSTIIHSKVIPLVIAMRAGDTVSHFTALRLPDEVYKTWPILIERGMGMPERLDEALQMLGYPRVNYRPALFPPDTLTAADVDDSEYSSGIESSYDSSTASSVPATDPTHLQPTEGFVSLLPSQDSTIFPLSPQLESSVSPSESSETSNSKKRHPTTPTSPASTRLSPSIYQALVDALQNDPASVPRGGSQDREFFK